MSMSNNAKVVCAGLVAIALAGCGSSGSDNSYAGPTDEGPRIVTTTTDPAPLETQSEEPAPVTSEPAPPAPATTEPTPEETEEQTYVLDKQSASGTLAQCHDPLNQWTAAPTGVVTVFIYTSIAQGMTYELTATVNGSHSQVGTVPLGGTQYEFEFPDVSPESVTQVVVTAADASDGEGDNAIGGSCIVPGSPTN